MRRLPEPSYLKFPLRIGARGPELSGRAAHVREQIEQVLMTAPGERLFRPDFGAGVKQLVFEPNSSVLWTVTQKRLAGSLAEALQGEVDPGTLEIAVEGSGEAMTITVGYQLARVGLREEHALTVAGEGEDG